MFKEDCQLVYEYLKGQEKALKELIKRLKKILAILKSHKKISAFSLIIILAGAWWGYGKITDTSGQTRYILAEVRRDTLITSVTGTGQVSASNQIDLKSKVSGDVVYLGISAGQEVGGGQLLVRLDDTEAQKSVRDAQVSLESAQISLQKTKQPADRLSLLQAENSLKQAESNLEKVYDDGLNTISNAFLDLPAMIAGLQDIIYGTTVSRTNQDNFSAYTDMVKSYNERATQFKNDALSKYVVARQAYDQTFNNYKKTNRFAGNREIEDLVGQTYETAKIVADSVKSANDFLNFVKDQLLNRQNNIPSILNTHQTSLSTYTSQANGHLLNLFNIKNTIVNYNLSLAEKTEALTKLKAGADPLDIKSQELSIQQRENALLDAKTTLDNYYIRAPFAGTVAKVDADQYSQVSPSTVIATLITYQKMAEISLNEVDISKIKVGQKATLTFDAVPDLSISGQVAEVDTVGTVSQGVVTYTVKISFDTQDGRVKPGMSVSSAVVTEVKPDVLLVPSSAVKSRDSSNYVEKFDRKITNTSSIQGIVMTEKPEQVWVETGLANDTETEIISGLEEGEQIVSRVITPQNAATTNTTPSLFGGGGRGGGNIRIQR